MLRGAAAGRLSSSRVLVATTAAVVGCALSTGFVSSSAMARSVRRPVASQRSKAEKGSFVMRGPIQAGAALIHSDCTLNLGPATATLQVLLEGAGDWQGLSVEVSDPRPLPAGRRLRASATLSARLDRGRVPSWFWIWQAPRLGNYNSETFQFRNEGRSGLVVVALEPVEVANPKEVAKGVGFERIEMRWGSGDCTIRELR
jgi:hypothetical protein